MKKIVPVLSAMSLLCVQASHADTTTMPNTPLPKPHQTPSLTQTPMPAVPPSSSSTQNTNANASNSKKPTPNSAVQPSTKNENQGQPAPDAASTAKKPTTSATPSTTAAPAEATPPTPAPIDCNYVIETSNLPSEDTVIKWVSFAAKKTFNYSYNNIDQSFKTLQACYTKNGWKSFNQALQSSGNIDMVKKEQLIVSPQDNGSPEILNAPAEDSKKKSWVVLVPLNITYQSKTQSVKQDLNVKVFVQLKKSNGKEMFGINQIIATPRDKEDAANSK